MTPAEVVNRQLDAYNARDVEAFAATYADDACIYRMPHCDLRFRGKAQIIEHYGGKTFKNPGLHAQILGRLVIGNKVVDHERAVGVRPEPFEVMVVYEVHDGLIQTVWFYEPDQISAPPGGV
ncbi:nuclear transport factor 2 family protein [Burkholderia alba]|uniref:nuclear transport factor 2 family protein n=1 Tax=Burkholderia alba TaxID=2683677 RepID=UPI002B05F098|nr:nuclear transport factor 2 family protein [Burkholderia alba]